MEPWIHEIMQSISSKDLIVLEVSKDLHIEEETHRHGHDQTTHDPHIWLDFGYDLMIIEKIVVALSRISPENSIHFHANARAYQEKLQILDRKYRTVLQRCRQRYLIIGGHAAFGYLTKRYNLQQVALYGISPDSKPTPRQLKEVIELGKKFDIKAIFFEEFIRDKLARIIAKELGAKTLILNPGSNLTREQIEAKLTFFDIMEQNLENLKNGLACQ
jgi:zinc transport system substrate-binding protein